MHKMWRWAQLTVAATVVLASLEPEKCHEHSFCEQFDPIKDIWNPCDSDDDPEDTCFVTATEQTATTANIITTSFNTTQNDDHSDITDHIFKGEFCQRSPGIYLIMFNNKTCKYDRNVTGLTMTTNNSHTTVSSNLTMEPSTPDFPKSTTIVQTTTLDVTTPSASIEITTSPPLSLLGLELEPNNMYNIVYENQAYQVKLSLMQPSPVKNLRTINISSSHIQLAWNNTKIIMNHNYKIHFRVKDVTSRDNYYSIPDVTWKIDELTPYTEYEVLLYVDEIYLNASHLSMPKKCTVRTKEAPPHKVQILDIIRNVHNLTLKWDLKKMEYNSKEVKFHVELYNQWKRETTQVFPKYSGHAVTFENLTPHTLYEFKIYAYNCAGEGGTVIDTVRLPIKEPPKNFSSVSASDITATTIKISVIKDKNADINGNITQYSVRVQEIEVKEWTEIKISESLFVHKERWTFTIGDDVTCTITDASCNRPLKPSTSYKLSLRAYTDVNLYKNSQDVLFSTASDNTALVAALAALSALAVCMWAALVWVCGAGDWLRSHVPCWGGVGVAPTPRRPPLTSHPIRLRDFPRYVRTVFNETPEKFGEEFDELKLVGREQPCIAANLPCNRHKNRFTNILPYDHSRFKLQPVDDEEGTDYINANYVPGFSSPRGFIATQGPMASTCGDFWRTVWESGAVAVVMLTRCVEKGAEKCEHYWPYDETPVTYGSVVVTLLEETHYCNWTTSELLICKGDEKRKVTHFQFTSWPDFGVPSPPSTLLQFVRAFRELVRPDQRPILVHCSAGVGRTGTFICLDRLMLQLSSRAEYLDVLGMVHGMRLARTNMVQTQQQYECVHICIASVVDAIEVCKRRSTLVSRRPAPTPLPRTVLPGRAAPAPPPPPRSSQHVHYNLAFEDDEEN